MLVASLIAMRTSLLLTDCMSVCPQRTDGQIYDLQVDSAVWSESGTVTLKNVLVVLESSTRAS